MATTPKPIHFPSSLRALIDPYLPPLSTLAPCNSSASQPNPPPRNRPHLTITYASSLDAYLSLSPSTPTALSGPASKAMTHFLRTRHDAILIGSGTAMADNPTLNSRLALSGQSEMVGRDMQPRPVILDGRGRWDVSESSRVIVAAREGKGMAPWIVVSKENVAAGGENKRKVLEECGGAVVECGKGFEDVLEMLWDKGIRSVMVEGGGCVINNLLSEHADLIDALIVTLAPVYLGHGGAGVRPGRNEAEKQMPAVQLRDVNWLPLERDVVMCARIEKR